MSLISPVPCESVGIPSAAILSVIQELEEASVPMHSLLIARFGKLAYEGYYAPNRPDDLHRMFSVTKSFVSAAIGALCKEGKLALDDPIIQYFPEYTPAEIHPWLAQTTIRNMLMMRSCHASTTYKVNLKANWVESFFTVPPTHKPGTVFHYDTSAAHTLCALVEKLSGKKMLDYLRAVCLDELGFSKEAYILEDPFGTSMGGSGIMMTSRDFLLFAMLAAGYGKVNGKQYLPEWYMKEALAFQSATCVTGPLPSEQQGYGYQFWRGEHGTIVLYGMGGQLGIIFPQYDCICITTADTQGYGGGNQIINNAIYRHLLPVLKTSDVSVSADPQVTTMLTQKTAALSILPLSAAFGAMTSPRSSAFSGRYYRIDDQPNSARWESLSFSFKNNEGLLSFRYDGKEYCLPFGFGFMKQSAFPIYGFRCISSAVWLSDTCLYIKTHLIDTSVGSVHIQFSFSDTDVTVFLKKQEETLLSEFNGHLHGI